MTTTACPPDGLGKLSHIVVLMMENRSFGHMLGVLKAQDPRIDGLTGNESNLDSTGSLAPVQPLAAYQGRLDPDPDHQFPGVDLQLFNGNMAPDRVADMQGFLASYQDYRFRGPNLLALQASVEHALWGPIGVFLQAEQGKVAEDSSDLDFSGLKSSLTVELTLRAGGFPMVNLSFSWGGEGQHVIGSMSSTLVGGSARPSLF